MVIHKRTKASALGDFVKIVADIRRAVLSVGCELHMDCAQELLHDGSAYADLWGANAYPADGRIDFISLINIRPASGNSSMEIKDPTIQQKVEKVVRELLEF